MSAQIPRAVPLTPKLAARIARRLHQRPGTVGDTRGRHVDVPEMEKGIKHVQRALAAAKHVVAASRFHVSPHIMERVMEKYIHYASCLHLGRILHGWRPPPKETVKFAISEMLTLPNAMYDVGLGTIDIPVEQFSLEFNGKEFPMGPYLMKMQPSEKSVIVLPCEGTPLCGMKIYCHPHVSPSGSLCMGSHREEIGHLLSQGYLSMAAEACLNILHHYGHDNPYKGLDQWDNTLRTRTCRLCGAERPETIMARCYCDEPNWFCLSCATLRNGRALCERCSARCYRCGTRSPKSTGTHIDGHFYCADCFCACADCGKATPKGSSHYTNCGMYVCDDCLPQALCSCGRLACKYCRTVHEGRVVCRVCQPQPQGVSV